jgi:hypothetical protein
MKSVSVSFIVISIFVKLIFATNVTLNEISDESCGVMSNTELVQGGRKSSALEFPWITTIFKRFNGVYLFAGSGTLISERHMICAANSIAYENYDEETGELNPHKNYIPYRGKDIKVILGSTHYKGTNASHELVIPHVGKIALHPNLHGTRPRIANIAVIKFRTKIPFTHFIQPACLWTSITDNILHTINNQLYAVGYGVDESGSISFHRKQIAMTIVGDDICQRFYRKAFKSESFFCARGNGVETPCKHDKPLYTKVEGRWYLNAMSSMFKIFRNNTCNVKAPVMYEDLKFYVSWIKEQMILL